MLFSNAVNTFNDHHRTLAEQLLHDIGRGNTCVHRTVALARSATLQEPTATLTKLASLFTDTGKNSERDLHRWIGTQAWGTLIPPTFDFLVDYADMSPCGTLPGEVTHSCLLPHELFHSVFTTSPCLFRHLFTGSDTELTDWWRAAATTDSDWYTKHPVVAACGRNPLMMLPYGIHGDDGGVAGGYQVLALTWGSVVRQMSTLDTRLAFTMIRWRILHNEYCIQYIRLCYGRSKLLQPVHFLTATMLVGRFQIRTIQWDSKCEVSRSRVASTGHSTNFAAIGNS